MFMLIDTHSHLNFTDFDKDRDEVIRRSLVENTWMINASINYLTSKKAVEIAEKYKKGIYAAVGLHPINIKQEIRNKRQEIRVSEDVLEEDFSYEKYRELTKSEKVVAIGEIGLDYWYKPKTKRKLELFKQKQKEIFLKQLNLAKELNLPIIIHCRVAHNDLLEILKGQEFQGVIHSFTGTWEQAERYLEMGFYLGFNGIIFKLNLNEIIKKVPLDRILIETDSPFLVPPPLKIKRCEPIFVKYIAQEIAEIRNENFEKIAQITTENAKSLFL